MIFDIKYKELVVYDGYAIAGEVLASGDFYERIMDVVKFTYTKSSSLEVAKNHSFNVNLFMSGAVNPVPVLKYYYKSKSVIATTYSNTRGIYVNSYLLRDVETYVGNGCHEFAHVPLGYSHGKTNFPPGSWRGYLMGDREDKNLSVPHMFATIGIQLAKEKGMIKK